MSLQNSIPKSYGLIMIIVSHGEMFAYLCIFCHHFRNVPRFETTWWVQKCLECPTRRSMKITSTQTWWDKVRRSCSISGQLPAKLSPESCVRSTPMPTSRAPAYSPRATAWLKSMMNINNVIGLLLGFYHIGFFGMCDSAISKGKLPSLKTF